MTTRFKDLAEHMIYGKHLNEIYELKKVHTIMQNYNREKELTSFNNYFDEFKYKYPKAFVSFLKEIVLHDMNGVNIKLYKLSKVKYDLIESFEYEFKAIEVKSIKILDKKISSIPRASLKEIEGLRESINSYREETLNKLKSIEEKSSELTDDISFIKELAEQVFEIKKEIIKKDFI